MSKAAKAVLDARDEVLFVLVTGRDISDAFTVLASAAAGTRDAQPYLDELLALAADAYRLTGASPDEPIDASSLVATYLPEYEYRGKVEHRNLRYALTYPALRAAGLDVNVWDDISYWRAELWPSLLHAILAYLRIAAERTGKPVADLAAHLQQHP